MSATLEPHLKQNLSAGWLTVACCWHKVTCDPIYFFEFAKYFFGFSDNSWICKFVWDLQNNICGFNNFIKICNSLSDLINSSTMISKKTLRFAIFFRILKTFFADFVNILGLSLIGFHSFILEVGCKL